MDGVHEEEVEPKQERVLQEVSQTIISLVRTVAPYEANGLRVSNKLKNTSRDYETAKYRWEKVSKLLHEKTGVSLAPSGVKRRVTTILDKYKKDNGINKTL